MRILNRLPVRILPFISLITAALLLYMAGCGSPPASEIMEETPREYSIADLAEIADPGLAYIEAEGDDQTGYYWFGSGFVVSSDGMIVTNYHVMDGAVSAIVEINGVTYDDVQVLAANEEWDLALLKVNTTDLQPLPLASTIDDVRLGEQVIAMGNPEGLKKTVSDGIISTVYRRLEGFNYDHIQTTAPISKGSSGGPLMNMRGEVIGVNTLTYLTGQNLNFAVPIDLVHNLIESREQPQSISAVFGYGSQGGTGYYEHRPGELAVVLNWEGEADLDLEIWTADFEFIGAAPFIGDSPDITQGSQGEEWFAFTRYETADNGEMADYSSGKYLVAVYYYGPEPADGIGETEATIGVYYPDGSSEIYLIEDLWYSPPYDQWFTLLVDAGEENIKVLDLYFDAPMIALLEWDTEADLDLIIWSENYDSYFAPFDFWYGYDIMDGKLGLETFRFGVFDIEEQSYDFTKGLHDVYVYMGNTGDPVTEATLTFVSDELELTRYNYTFTPDPLGDYLWLAAYDLNTETLKYFEPDTEQQIVYQNE